MAKKDCSEGGRSEGGRESAKDGGKEGLLRSSGANSNRQRGPELKLCGYALAVLREEAEDGGERKVEVGSPCFLVGQGSDTEVEVENTGVLLVPVSKNCIEGGRSEGGRESAEYGGKEGLLRSTPDRDLDSCCVTSGIVECTPVVERVASGNVGVADSGGTTPAGESVRVEKWRVGGMSGKRGGGAGSSSGKKVQRSGVGCGSKICTTILHQLQFLVQRNNAVVAGRVVQKSRGGAGGVRYLVLLDVYLSASLWTSTRNFWRNGSLVAVGLSHLGCDWNHRASILQRMDTNKVSGEMKDRSLWAVGDCLVYGCKLHCHLSEGTKGARFDLHSLFKSLPSYDGDQEPLRTCIEPDQAVHPLHSGICSLPDEIVTTILGRLLPRTLHSMAAVCRHLRTLARSVMPCMNLRLFAHQQSAVRWMLQRELSPQTLSHPYIREMQTEDGFHIYLDSVTGDLSSEMPPPLSDFRGGLFCDEPGLGKTVTALSLILKTQGTLSRPPPGVNVRWCQHHSDLKYGYYEISNHAVPHGVSGMSALKRCSTLKARRYQFDSTDSFVTSSASYKRSRGSTPLRSNESSSSNNDCSNEVPSKRVGLVAGPPMNPVRTSFRVKRKLWDAYGGTGDSGNASKVLKDMRQSPVIVLSPNEQGITERANAKMCSRSSPLVDRYTSLYGGGVGSVQRECSKQETPDPKKIVEPDVLWAQCDACSKWRKLPEEAGTLKEGLAWFCSMNKDPFYQECSVPEEPFDTNETITSLPGFTHSGKNGEQDLNVSFFRNVLKEHAQFLDVEAKRAVTWLAEMSPETMAKAAVGGFAMPAGFRLVSVSGQDQHQYDRLFQSFGLIKRKEAKKTTRWYYPKGLNNLVFDSRALKVALSDPVDDVTRFYLSKATLIVVPQNLIEHWRTQIRKHTTPGQLQVFIWNDVKKPPAAHSLAWDYDIVITTFSRLSVEWSSRDSSALVRVHWLRIVLDEGHTLGASLSLTNKLQMAISMQASRRWLLTGTPTPNTPSSQLAHLQPMLRFLHEEVYGKHQKVWEGAIVRPFEAGREEGRERLMSLLHRCMISARKSDLHSIPPCVRNVKLLDFTEQHAESYNELVVTVKRNILMADWKDPTHVESLLNPKQWKFRSTTIRNVRLSCCVAGHIKVRNAGEDIQETMDMLVDQGMDPGSEEFATIKSSLIHGGICQRCSEWCRLPIVTPCSHLLCLSCVGLDSERCTIPGCGNPYKMQSPEDRARPENPNPKWPVPQDLIELQPSYVQNNWDPDWHATSSSKVAYLVQQLKELQVRNEKKMLCECTWQPGVSSSLVDVLGDQEFLQACKGTSSETLWEPEDFVRVTQNFLPEKAIIFSQFLEHINVVEQQLAAAELRSVGMYSPMHSANKMKSLMTFKKDPECIVLVMDGSAALGLDLSFVTHVYLMEPIWDRSMEEQVVSRAHRMGATRSVLVETLAMRGTIEEQMLEFLKDPIEFSRSDREVQDIGERSKPSQKSMHDPAESSYLAHLDFVRTRKI